MIWAWTDGLLSDVGCARPWYQPEIFYALFLIKMAEKTMAIQIFDDFRKEYWYHVSNQNEIPIFGHAEKSIDSELLYNIAQQMPGKADDLEILKQVISLNVDAIDTLRTIVGVTDKRMYLELSYIFNKHRNNRNSELNILGESVYSLKKHSVSYFKRLIGIPDAKGKEVLNVVAKYLEDRGVLSILHVLNKMDKKEVNSLVDFLLLPKEIQQEETKKRGHGAEQTLALVLHNIGASFIPDRRHINPMSQDDQNVTKDNFELAQRDEASTWSMDLIIKQGQFLRVFVQGLIHSSDPGQYGVNKSGETVSVKKGLVLHNETSPTKKELWGLVDGVGFIENPENTIFKMLQQFDTFVQLKSLYKAGLKLHKLGIVKIKAIRFDMDFYTENEADEMFELYGSDDIIKVTDNSIPAGREVQAGKAWLYV